MDDYRSKLFELAEELDEDQIENPFMATKFMLYAQRLYYIGDYFAAELFLLDKAIETLKTSFYEHYLTAIGIKAKLLYQKSEYEKAEELALESAYGSITIRDHSNAFASFDVLSRIFEETGRKDDALDVGKILIQLSKAAGEFYAFRAFIRIGEILISMEEYDKVLNYLNNSEYDNFEVDFLKSKLEYNRGNLDTSIGIMEKIRTEISQTHQLTLDTLDKRNYLGFLCQLYLEKQNYNKAHKILQEIVNTFSFQEYSLFISGELPDYNYLIHRFPNPVPLMFNIPKSLPGDMIDEEE